MKYIPSKSLHRKYFKIRKYKTIHRSKPLVFGRFGVKVLESFRISNFFIEKLHLFLRRKLKKKGKVWFRIMPFIISTKKPLEVRMGKGKGPFDCWIYHVKKAQVFLEFSIFDSFLLRKIIKGIKMKLPVKVKIITRNL